MRKKEDEQYSNKVEGDVLPLTHIHIHVHHIWGSSQYHITHLSQTTLSYHILLNRLSTYAV